MLTSATPIIKAFSLFNFILYCFTFSQLRSLSQKFIILFMLLLLLLLLCCDSQTFSFSFHLNLPFKGSPCHVPLGYGQCPSPTLVSKRANLPSFPPEQKGTYVMLFLPGPWCKREWLKGIGAISCKIHCSGRVGLSPNIPTGCPLLCVLLSSSWNIPGSCPFVKLYPLSTWQYCEPFAFLCPVCFWLIHKVCHMSKSKKNVSIY